MIYMQNFYAAVYCYRNEALKALRGRVLGEACFTASEAFYYDI